MNAPAQLPTNDVFSWPVRVYWEDTDGGGIVYYANYLKYFERARTEWLRALGLEQRKLQETAGGLFVVSEANVKFLRSARLDDMLQVTARLCEMGRSSFSIAQQVRLSLPHDAAQVLCTASVRVGWINSTTHRPARMPASVVDVFPR
ncbi:MAG: tol-pal system-associated acyl-CoA thioesterase [Rhodoferax sp.]|nr:tol-pal system-associated acyl-CoA thioesterase [Rhodoferax sp.]